MEDNSISKNKNIYNLIHNMETTLNVYCWTETEWYRTEWIEIHLITQMSSENPFHPNETLKDASKLGMSSNND